MKSPSESVELKRYSVGHLRNPRPEDKRFALRNDAIVAAFAGAKDDDVWAVWFDDSISVVVYDGESFT